jgi:hypothetical protein
MELRRHHPWQQRDLRLWPAAVRLTGAVTLAVLCVLQQAAAVPLSDWHSGIATNYGGAQDGMNPYDPSFGTKEVRRRPC